MVACKLSGGILRASGCIGRQEDERKAGLRAGKWLEKYSLVEMKGAVEGVLASLG